MKKQLHQQLQQATTHQQRLLLLEYYIATWGGIHANSAVTLELYSRATPHELIARGREGIASWSKALSIIAPEQYAIFDARVSAALNALQIIHNTENKQLFPVLSSRNNTIKKGITLFKQEAEKAGWVSSNEKDFYAHYLGYLENTVIALKPKYPIFIYTIEILLFAKAEELVKQAFPDKSF